jgi:hypothetical protein
VYEGSGDSSKGLATQFYLEADASEDDIKATARLAMDNYARLDEKGDRPLNPAGVYLATDQGWDWVPAAEAAG